MCNNNKEGEHVELIGAAVALIATEGGLHQHSMQYNRQLTLRFTFNIFYILDNNSTKNRHTFPSTHLICIKLGVVIAEKIPHAKQNIKRARFFYN